MTVLRVRQQRRSLEISRWSNRLAFDRRHRLSVTSGNEDGLIRAPCPSAVAAPPVKAVTETTKGSRTKHGIPYMELDGTLKGSRHLDALPHPESLPRRTGRGKLHNHPRLAPKSSTESSDEAPILSQWSPHCRRVSRTSLDILPVEILDQICTHLTQETLRSLCQTNTHLLKPAPAAMYRQPSFASTYRFAQFVSTITNSTGHATMLRGLDLSNVSKDADADASLAGWREWRYRKHDVLSKQRYIHTNTRTPASWVDPRRSRPSRPSVAFGEAHTPEIGPPFRAVELQPRCSCRSCASRARSLS